MDTVLDLDELERPEEDEESRGLDEDLMEAATVLRDRMCPRCHYDTDEDGYCAMCGATLGRL